MGNGYFYLQTGDIFQGTWIGAEKDVTGEVVFNTSMTGYQEIMSDPSYKGQIITFCYPLIGNYGVSKQSFESDRIQAEGVIWGEGCDHPSHYSAEHDVRTLLEKHNVSGLIDVDTRSIVKRIRQHGTLGGYLSTIPPERISYAELKAQWKQANQRAGSCLVQEVSTKKNMSVSSAKDNGPHIVLVDYGYKKSIVDALAAHGCKVTVVPYTTSSEQVRLLQPEGVVFSNGPGDPATLQSQSEDVYRISTSYPAFGICLGHQVLALAHGAKTEKLKFGHRGANHPVKELETGRVFMTAQNHSYVVQRESVRSSKMSITYTNVNDGTVEGLRHTELPIQSVQFHPEAHPGPKDTYHLFEKFITECKVNGEIVYATT